MTKALQAVAPNKVAPEHCPIRDSILCVARPHLRPIIRQELKASGVQSIHNAENIDQCIELMRQWPMALLVLSYDQGDAAVNNVLRQAQSPLKAETRPILLISTAISSEVVSTSAEYFVSRVMSGEISRTTLQGHLEVLMADEWDAQQVRPQLNRVASARLREDYQAATTILRELHLKFPDDIRLACELADSHIQQREWTEAKKILDIHDGAKSRHLRAKHLYARCLMREGRHDEAVPILESTRLINPNNVDRLIDLGTALMHCDRIMEAQEAFDAALNIDQSNKEAAKGKAQCRLMEGDVNEALILMRQISGPRELASIFNNAAILSIRAGRFDAGFNLYHSALRALGQREPAAASVLFNLGVAYHKLNKASEALQCFEKAYELDDQLDKARHNALIVASKLGRAGMEVMPNVAGGRSVAMPGGHMGVPVAGTSQAANAAQAAEFEDEVLR